MTVIASDILLLLSGGSSNTDPNLSLGGDPSSVAITTGINNLFDDISEDEALLGKTDYRCFYVVNDNAIDSAYQVKFYIDSEVSDGSAVILGISKTTDTQRLIVTGNPSGGSFTISYEGNPVVIAYDANPTTWALNLQNGLNSVGGLTGVQVTVNSTTGTTVFTIKFMGADNYRNHDLIVLVTNALTGGSTTISITKLVEGAPINFIAPTIGLSTTTPSGISFMTSSNVSPIDIGTLQPLDMFAIWVQRITVDHTDAIPNDGFVFRISMKPLP